MRLGQREQMTIRNLPCSLDKPWKLIGLMIVNEKIERQRTTCLYALQGFHGPLCIRFKSGLNADPHKADFGNRAGQQPFLRADHGGEPLADTGMFGVFLMGESHKDIHIEKEPHG